MQFQFDYVKAAFYSYSLKKLDVTQTVNMFYFIYTIQQGKGKNIRGGLQNIGMQLGQPAPKAPTSPRKSNKSLKLRGPGTRKSSIATTVTAE